jgi:hypothetical protein
MGDVGATGSNIVQAVREMLNTFPDPAEAGRPSAGVPSESSTLNQLIQEPTALAMYQSLAMLAATIRWAAHETGRDEQEVLNELGKNYSGT